MRLLLVGALALAGGWAGASGLMVCFLNNTGATDRQLERLPDHLPFPLFPPLAVEPLPLYPLISCAIVIGCGIVCWLLGRQKARSKEITS